MTKKTTRRTFTPEQKAVILRRHLQDKIPISDLCDEYGMSPSVLYLWQKQALENLTAVFEGGRNQRKTETRENKLERKIENLEARISRKDSVIAEISEEYVQLKKELGEP